MGRIVTDLDKHASASIKQLLEAAKGCGQFRNQEEFARALGVTQSFVSGVITGKFACPTELILKVAKIFSVSPRTIRPDLPDFRPPNEADEPIDEALMTKVLKEIFQALRERGADPQQISDESIAKLAAKAYKVTQETKVFNRQLISFSLDFLV